MNAPVFDAAAALDGIAGPRFRRDAALIKKLAIGAAVLGVLVCGGFAGVTATLSDQIGIVTTKELSASPEALYPLLTTQDGLWAWWTVASEEGKARGWGEMPMAKPAGPTEGVGTKFVFGTEESPMERWEIVAVEPPVEVVYSVDFGVFAVERTLTLKPNGAGTTMTWAEAGTIDNPVYRWFPVLMPPDSAVVNFHMAMSALDEAAAK